MADILIDSNYYQRWLKYSNLAASTKLSYTSQLKKFSQYLMDCGFYGDLDFDKFYFYKLCDEYGPIDAGFFDDYVDHLESEGYSVHTIYRNIEAVRSFFCFLEDRELIESNPIRYYGNPYYKPTLIDRSLSKSDSDKLLLAALSLDPFLRQLYLMILLMLTCGLRASEVCMLRFSQIDFHTGGIVINRGQKTKARTVMMSPALIDEFQRYFNHQVWQEWSQGEDKEVFFHKDSALSYRILRQWMNVISMKAGFKKPVTPHQLRYTMARLMMEQGHDLFLIQKQLRHANLETTLRYLPKSLWFKQILEE